MLDISVIIINWNTSDLLIDCINSIYQNIEDLKFEVIVIDNASSDRSCETVKKEFPDVHLIENRENIGFARANNQAAKIARGKYFLLINSDALLLPGTLQAMLFVFKNHPKAGMGGARLINPDGSFQASYTNFPNLWQEFLILSGLGRLLFGYWHPSHGPDTEKGAQVIDYVEGACLLVNGSVYLETGGLDEQYFMYAEEVDLCYRLYRSGWQVWYQPAAKVIHIGSGSSKTRRPQREADLYQSSVRFYRKFYGSTKTNLLKVLILFFTSSKIVLHKFLRLISIGQRGRDVVTLKRLIQALRDV